ncbi:MAG: FKBP-type peptidyl-prolyl cis-trans isomerase [Saprospiraceae bacterium]|nr:FKBP-type peptidyl-prolyl cis-trans isomerase [Saprospiraceae bacterium]MCF8248581.1 FKBP-type peptidyl-prolyl cis-trans isomerase [Saprospiraceae bacterium]MCF8280252.1 FKBP-type peptidyl-prolyl cis-trans isomerase [Bacteroidales bacterium]MCF8310314.1 FKBP-type peptidyl-prolyl cis-trans isomerase [Saprospiraceae bacterium]MCF8439246.1 FKBP-type peptidyl-prolyl cis-trans isomerase [Saprospiraceae bacterium]
MFFLLGLFCFSAIQAQELKSEKDSVSYALGVLIGQNLQKQGLSDLDLTLFSKGMKAATDGTPLLNPVVANKCVNDFTTREREANKQKAMSEGAAFLAKNAERPGVITLPSGLQYEVLTDGTGEIPKTTDKVKVHYTGKLLDGTVFDSSVERGEPIVFPVTGVIQGWVEALQLMKVGSKWKLFIPQNLAYGERGSGAQIGPYSTLVFDVELLGIE